MQFYIIPKIFYEMGIGYSVIADISSLNILSYFIAGSIILPIIHRFKLRYLMIFSLAFIVINWISLFIDQQYSSKLTKINIEVLHVMFASAMSFIYLIAIFLEIINHYPYSPRFCILISSTIFILGYMLGNQLGINLDNDLFEFIIINIVVALISIILIFATTQSNYVRSMFKTNFAILIHHVELILISGLVSMYIIVSIITNYYRIVSEDSLDILYTMKDYIAIGFCLANLLILFLPIKSKYNIAFIILFFVLTAIITKFHHYKQLNIAGFIGIGCCACMIVYNNLVDIINKFQNKELTITITTYFTVLALGAYVGKKSTELISLYTGSNGLLLSVLIIISVFLLYFFYRRKVNIQVA
ncbi:MAG: hypothetical protein AB8B67_03455 [Rickettsiaceae bacterium]